MEQTASADLPEVLNLRDLARVLDLTPDYVRRKLRSGWGLPYTQVGDKIVVLRADLLRWMKANRARPTRR